MKGAVPAAPVDQDSNRREFLRGAARYSLLTTFAVLGGWIATRPASANACPFRQPCQDCRRFSGCELPPAITARRTT